MKKQKKGMVAYGWRRIYARRNGKFIAIGWGRPVDWEGKEPPVRRFRIQNNPEGGKK